MPSTATIARDAVETGRGCSAVVPLDVTTVSFWNVTPDVVRVEARVGNSGQWDSPPTRLLLEAAPLGAFVPWKPLASLPVPALAPGEVVRLRTEVMRPGPVPLGDFRKVPPRALLTALGRADGLPPSRRPAPGWLPTRLLRGGQKRRSEAGKVTGVGLPPDPLELLGRRNPHWAGNVNVFVGNKALERHLARALRVYPGRTNLAAFVVGAGRDAYAFELRGQGAAWNTRLHEATRARLLLDVQSAPAVRWGEWLETAGRLLILLAMCPPAGCQAGELQVHVTQRSSGKSAVVEFSLDPAAEGPGCFAV